MQDIYEKAKQQALSDWGNRRVVYWICGRLDSSRPAFIESQIFYPQVCFIRTSEEEKFYSAYNQTINELIDKEGIPDWAPVNRIPDRSAVLQIFATTGQDISTFTANSIRERNLVNSVLSKWSKGQPQIWNRSDNQSILIFAGNTTEKAARVDVLDMNALKWLVTFEFLRRHHPTFPWDN